MSGLDPLVMRRRRERGVLLATSGLALGLAVGLCLHFLGISRLTIREWWTAVLATAAIQGAIWIMARTPLDRRLRWDPHFVLVPMIGAAAILSFYGYVVFEARVLVLMAWQIGLLFLAGRVGFRGVTLLSLLMGAGYSLGVVLEARRGLPVSIGFELTVLAAFMAMTLYAAVIFERLQREHREMGDLRRRLTAMALTDALTGLPNRRQIEDTLLAELARIRRHGGCLSLVMVDVDHFKQYNDRHGHPEGDRALRRLADVIHEHTRSGDTAGRYGGEEFALVLFQVSAGGAATMMERLRSAVAALDWGAVGPGPTISAGIASCPDDGTEIEPLVRAADAALYAAKAAGRNRVSGTAPPS